MAPTMRMSRRSNMVPRQSIEKNDEFNLDRFVAAQETTFDAALSELEAGRKESHWMWFIFPQIDGLGSSPTAKHYAIKSAAEAEAYLNHPILGPRLIQLLPSAIVDPGEIRLGDPRLSG